MDETFGVDVSTRIRLRGRDTTASPPIVISVAIVATIVCVVLTECSLPMTVR